MVATLVTQDGETGQLNSVEVISDQEADALRAIGIPDTTCTSEGEHDNEHCELVRLLGEAGDDLVPAIAYDPQQTSSGVAFGLGRHHLMLVRKPTPTPIHGRRRHVTRQVRGFHASVNLSQVGRA